MIYPLPQNTMRTSLLIFLLATIGHSQKVPNNGDKDGVPVHSKYDDGVEMAPKNISIQKNETGPPIAAQYFYTYYTSRGYECSDSCARSGGTSYYWCRVLMEEYTWDYCSPAIGVDYYMRPCSTYCSFNGQKYKWCYVGQDKSWGYCSDNNGSGVTEFSHFVVIFSLLSSIIFSSFYYN